jgi:hypothetical protein
VKAEAHVGELLEPLPCSDGVDRALAVLPGSRELSK